MTNPEVPNTSRFEGETLMNYIRRTVLLRKVDLLANTFPDGHRRTSSDGKSVATVSTNADTTHISFEETPEQTQIAKLKRDRTVEVTITQVTSRPYISGTFDMYWINRDTDRRTDLSSRQFSSEFMATNTQQYTDLLKTVTLATKLLTAPEQA